MERHFSSPLALLSVSFRGWPWRGEGPEKRAVPILCTFTPKQPPPCHRGLGDLSEGIEVLSSASGVGFFGGPKRAFERPPRAPKKTHFLFSMGRAERHHLGVSSLRLSSSTPFSSPPPRKADLCNSKASKPGHTVVPKKGEKKIRQDGSSPITTSP